MSYENPNQKGTALTGGLATDEVLASSDSLLKPNAYAAGQKGAQQFYTPEPAAKLIARVFGTVGAVLDPTAGDGSLLQFFDAEQRYGVEIDADQIQNSKDAVRGYRTIQGDLQHIFTLMSRTVTFPIIVANPPFGLDWEEPTLNEGRTTNSALLTLMMMNRLLTDEGQFAFIAGKGRFYKSIAGKPDAAGIYATIDCDDLFDGTQTPSVIAFGMALPMRAEARNPTLKEGFVTREMPRENLDLLGEWVLEQRQAAAGEWGSFRPTRYHQDQQQAWPTIQAEYTRRTKERLKSVTDRVYDIELYGGDRLNIEPKAFTKLVLNKLNKLHGVSKLNGASVNYFIQNERDWIFLCQLEKDGLISIQPRVHERVDLTLREMRKQLMPMYPLTPVMRLGYLQKENALKCILDDPERGFLKGVWYDLDTQTTSKEKTEYRPTQIKSGKRAGEWEDRTYTKMGKVMKITVGHWSMTDSEEDTEDIQYLLDHFDIPDPGDVATNYPVEYERQKAILREVEQEVHAHSVTYFALHGDLFPPVMFRDFQIEDIARLNVKGDGMLAWEQGLGKTLAGVAYAKSQMKQGVREQVLIICPRDLISQWKREVKRFAGIDLEVIDGSKTPLTRTDPKTGKTKKSPCIHIQAKNISRSLLAGGTGWFITYPEALSITGTSMSTRMPDVVVKTEQVEKARKGTGRSGYYKYLTPPEGERFDGEVEPITNAEYWEMRGDTESEYSVGYGYIPQRFDVSTKEITSREVCPECHADTRNGWNGTYCTNVNPDGATCGYAHFDTRVKPIASILATAFRQGIVINDEATMVQGDDSLRSLAIRGLRAKRKLGMTGTPIKNYVHQAFWPLWWCLGNNSPRFGYGYEDKPKFAENFCVFESYKVKGDNKKKGGAHLPEVTNLSRFWQQTSSSIIRRRKEDTGEPLVPRYFFPVSVPLGQTQVKLINKWRKTFGSFFAEMNPDAPLVRANMQEIMAPMLGMQQKLEYAEIIPQADPDKEWNPDEKADPLGDFQNLDPSNWTPAVFKTMELAMGLVKEGRKVLIGSPLIATSQFLAEQLQEKGVNAIHIVDASGNTQSADQRSKTVHQFQTNDVDVLCTGVAAIRFGHNLDQGSAVIMLGLPWDFESMDQFIARIHRLTSKRSVHVYVVLPGEDTLTAKKWQLLNLKGATASLALDGAIKPRSEVEIDKKTVIAEFVEKGVTVTGEEMAEEDVRVAWRQVAQLEQFVTPPDLLGTPPEGPTPDELRAAEAFGAFVRFYGKAPKTEAVIQYDQPIGPERKRTLTVVSDPFPIPVIDQELADEFDAAEAEVIAEAVEQLVGPETAPAPATDPTPVNTVSDLVSELKSLAELHDLGILDDEEFKEAKAVSIAAAKAATRTAAPVKKAQSTTTDEAPQLSLLG